MSKYFLDLQKQIKNSTAIFFLLTGEKQKCTHKSINTEQTPSKLITVLENIIDRKQIIDNGKLP